MLNKTELINELVERGVGDRRHVSHMINALAEVGVEQLQAGEDFVLPGLVRLSYSYRKAQKKGERWRKGEEVTGFGGVTSVKDTDSPPVKAKIRLVAKPTGAAARVKPGSRPEAQSEFLKSSTGKAVVRRLG